MKGTFMSKRIAILKPGTKSFSGSPTGPRRRIVLNDAPAPHRYPFAHKFDAYPVRGGTYLKGADGTYVNAASVERYEP
jgi:hypothetical protein